MQTLDTFKEHRKSNFEYDPFSNKEFKDFEKFISALIIPSDDFIDRQIDKKR